ncbi:MAG: Ig-like domain-containing protein [Bifidobacteriaceae bacterium]|nr:Ig-like domain-containing protein [Bifidobacteriaceae bacterium]
MNQSIMPARRRIMGPAAAAIIGIAASVVLGGGGAGAAEPRPLVYLHPDYSSGDLTGDHRVDAADLAVLTRALGATGADPRWADAGGSDADGDGVITVADIAALSKQALYDDGEFDLLEASVLDIQRAMEAGRLTAVELTQAYLDRIAAYDSAEIGGAALNSIIGINPHALEIAAALDAERAESGPRGLLHGIPVIAKDNYNTLDMPTTAGCKCLLGNQTDSDAFMVARLRAAGAVIIAKSNLAEFAFGTNGISAIKETTNVYLPGRTSGGSSAGTGASISANFGVIGLGTDTGGSIRIPSSYSGLVGLRPTVGLLSRDGIIPLALSQDTGGPMTRTVADAAIALDAMAASDAANDPASAATDAQRPASYAAHLDAGGLDGARIGYVSADAHIGANAGIVRLFENAKATMADQGATLVDIGSVPLANTTSGSTNEFRHDINGYLAKFVKAPGAPNTLQEIVDAITADPTLTAVGSTVVQRNGITAEQYDAWMVTHTADIESNRAGIQQILDDNDLDAIALPPVQGFPGWGSSGNNNRISALSSVPSLSVPMGTANAQDVAGGNETALATVGASANIEFLGRMYAEPTLLKLGYAFEQATKARPVPARYPDLDAGAVPEPAAPSIPTFRLAVSPASPRVGSTVDVAVNTAGLSGAYAYSVELAFDPAKLAYVAGSAASGTSGFTDAVAGDGVVTLVHAKLGASPAAEGAFALVSARFQAIGDGGAQVAVRQVAVAPEEGGPLLTALSRDEREVTVLPAVDPTPSSTGQPVPTQTVTVTAAPDPPAGPSQGTLAKLTRLGAPAATLYVVKGKTLRLPVVGYGSVGAVSAIAVTSSKPGVAKASGLKSLKAGGVGKVAIKAKKVGTAKVKVKAAGGQSVVVKVKVVRAAAKATRLTVKGAAELKRSGLAAGAAKTLKAKVVPAKATGAVVKWKSSNPLVASVDAAGRVTAKAPGKTTITAKLGSKTAKLPLTIH